MSSEDWKDWDHIVALVQDHQNSMQKTLFQGAMRRRFDNRYVDFVSQFEETRVRYNEIEDILDQHQRRPAEVASNHAPSSRMMAHQRTRPQHDVTPYPRPLHGLGQTGFVIGEVVASLMSNGHLVPNSQGNPFHWYYLGDQSLGLDANEATELVSDL